MLAGMTAAQLARWRAFAAAEPFGFDAEWLRFGMLASVIVNSNPFRGANAPTAQPSQFVPRVKRPDAEPDDGDLGEMAADLNAVPVLRGNRG